MEGGQYCMKFSNTRVTYMRVQHLVGEKAMSVSVSNYTFAIDPSSLTLKGTYLGRSSKSRVTLRKISMD